jgi:hypothetical protein
MKNRKGNLTISSAAKKAQSPKEKISKTNPKMTKATPIHGTSGGEMPDANEVTGSNQKDVRAAFR